MDDTVRVYFYSHYICRQVINVSGHRIGTAEVESALVLHPAVAQAAVVARPHPIKGQAIVAFVMLDVSQKESPELIKSLINQVRSEIGPFAAPDNIYVSPSLPMTRSGKIMRRILRYVSPHTWRRVLYYVTVFVSHCRLVSFSRKIICGETDSLGDTSTLADPSIVDTLIAKVANLEPALSK